MIDPIIYLHESDKVALKALKAIPGFSQVVKAFLSVWNEKQFRIENMSGRLRLSEKQMAKYYNMLPPICEKLGIEVPELYLELNVQPNAYTSGDTNPFIVITSGLLETMPDELIPTVLAHECGHIVCHHVLYSTMGRLIINGLLSSFGTLSTLISTPLKMAFYYWMRCSEFSADRVAAIYDGTSEKMVETCMRFAGYDKDIVADVSIDEFMKQAIEYKQMVDENKMNKAMEVLAFSMSTHPLLAVRAYDCNEWGHSDLFNRVIKYINRDSNNMTELPILKESKYFIGKNCDEVINIFSNYGFKNISKKKTTEKGLLTQNGQTVKISINGNDTISEGEWYPVDSNILVAYYEPETAEEEALAHVGQIQMPDFSRKYLGRDYKEVVSELTDAGFTNVIAEPWIVKKSLFNRNDSIAKITIAGLTTFDKGDWFNPNAVIRINYQKIMEDN